MRATLTQAGRLTRWHLLDCGAQLPRGDEIVRLDAALASWLLGDAGALLHDPAVSAILEGGPWRGANALSDQFDLGLADSLAAAHSHPMQIGAGGDPRVASIPMAGEPLPSLPCTGRSASSPYLARDLR